MLEFLRLLGGAAEGKIRRAALLGRGVSFVYYSPSNREVTERGVRIKRVWRESGKTYFSGECGLRGAKRTFRLDRVVCFARA